VSREAVHTWVAKFSLGRSIIADDALLRLRQKQLCSGWKCSVFRPADKAMGLVLSLLVEVMSGNKCFFRVRILHALRFVSILGPFTDSPSQ
jgi:hypothetical protein